MQNIQGLRNNMLNKLDNLFQPYVDRFNNWLEQIGLAQNGYEYDRRIKAMAIYTEKLKLAIESIGGSFLSYTKYKIVNMQLVPIEASVNSNKFTFIVTGELRKQEIEKMNKERE